jgi:hypothetical protein
MTKRITVEIAESIDDIRDFIQGQTGVRMTYVQIFDHLIHFYIKHACSTYRQRVRELRRCVYRNAVIYRCSR